MSEATFSFQVDASLKEQLTTAAKARDASEAELMREFMRDFVKRQQQEAAEYDVQFRQAVQAGIDAANAGDVLSAEEVEADAAVWRADVQRKFSAG
jgi:predicted transcriptional regulator